MNPLLAEPETGAPAGSEPGEPAGPGGSGSNGGAPEPEARTCDACGAAMAPEQDWCLECGTAAPGRLGTRPGWRAMVTVVGATLLLATGAVAAGYAALSEDANVEASQPAPPAAGPVAQAPPPLPPASAPPATAPPAASAPTAPSATLPTVPAPSPAPAPGAAVPAPPPAATPLPVPTPPSSGGATGGGESGGSQGDPGSGGSGTKGTGDSGSGSSGSSEKGGGVTRTAVAIPDGGVKIYDPYKRLTVKGDPADAHDGSRDTVTRLATKTPGEAMGVGLVIDLGKETAVGAVEILSDTPGYRLETYGATSDPLPPDILDTRWKHFTDIGSFDRTTKDGNTKGDDIDRLSLGGERKIRRLALWVTTPPERAPLVRISEIRLFR